MRRTLRTDELVRETRPTILDCCNFPNPEVFFEDENPSLNLSGLSF